VTLLSWILVCNTLSSCIGGRSLFKMKPLMFRSVSLESAYEVRACARRQAGVPGRAERVRAHGEQVRRLPRTARAGAAAVGEAGLAGRGRAKGPPRRRALRAHAPARVLQQPGAPQICTTP
jgi:hypothetical protein